MTGENWRTWGRKEREAVLDLYDAADKAEKRDIREEFGLRPGTLSEWRSRYRRRRTAVGDSGGLPAPGSAAELRLDLLAFADDCLELAQRQAELIRRICDAG